MKKNKLFITVSFFSLIALTSCAQDSPSDPDEIIWEDEVLGDPMVDPTNDNYRTFYEIFTSSFSDTNGDGIGDLKGITNRLDYLNDGDVNSGKSLGVQGIWLTPIFQSPSYHKYDVSDYYKIDSSFGKLEDLKNLLDQCHKRNVKLILDLVLNHTSVNNTWFIEFKRAHTNNDESSVYYNFYEWYTETPVGHTSRVIPGTNHYYECNFSSEMPELNYDNPKVYEEMVKVAKYWIDQGVDGYRFDAAKYIYFKDEKRNVEFWNKYAKDIKDYAKEKYNKDLYMIGEVWDSDSILLPYNSSINTFNFSVAGGEGYISNSVKAQDGNIYTKYTNNFLTKLYDVNPDAIYAPFIANHDTDRAAGYLTVGTGTAYMAANLYLLNPGSPFIYYGEEIGMKGSRGSASTDANRRLAMLWGDEDTIRNPKGTTYSSQSQTNGTVATQINSKSSLLTRYRKLIQIRTKYDWVRKGRYEGIQNKENLGIFKVTLDNKVHYIIHNLSIEDIEFDLSTLNATKILESIGLNPSNIQGNTLKIGAFSSILVE